MASWILCVIKWDVEGMRCRVYSSEESCHLCISNHVFTHWYSGHGTSHASPEDSPHSTEPLLCMSDAAASLGTQLRRDMEVSVDHVTLL